MVSPYPKFNSLVFLNNKDKVFLSLFLEFLALVYNQSYLTFYHVLKNGRVSKVMERTSVKNLPLFWILHIESETGRCLVVMERRLALRFGRLTFFRKVLLKPCRIGRLDANFTVCFFLISSWVQDGLQPLLNF